MIEATFVERIAAEVRVRPEQVAGAVPLFDRGATVPFVARYRKDATQGLEEEVLERIAALNGIYTALLNRRNALLENLTSQNRLTEALRERISACTDPTELEDLYLSFKKPKRSKATVAIEQSLEPLAAFIWAQQVPAELVQIRAEAFVSPEKSVSSPEEALLGAYYILAERIAFDPDARKLVRDRMCDDGVMRVVGTKNAEPNNKRFSPFYDFAKPLKDIEAGRLLTILRGSRMSVLRMDLVVDDAALIQEIVALFLKDPESQYAPHLHAVVDDAYKRLLRPELENEVITNFRRQAEESLIDELRASLAGQLDMRGVGATPLMGIFVQAGNAYAAVVGADGALKAHSVYALVEGGLPRLQDGCKSLRDLIAEFEVQGLALGSGEGAADAARLALSEMRGVSKKPFRLYVSETLAAAYAVSKEAEKEFPELPIPVRQSVSLARKLQEPLFEYARLDPRSLVTAPFAHEVSQKLLREGLATTFSYAINRIGVDVNTAAESLLQYVSGIQGAAVENLVAKRTELGGFTNRAQLLEVSGIGEKSYEMCAGFICVKNGDNPLDATAIHPEAYATIAKMAETAGVSVAELIGNADAVRKLNFADFASEILGEKALRDLRAELLAPGHDPRPAFIPPRYVDGACTVDELREGMEADGIITNITKFGVFVDIGVQQDGLVHLSELANTFVGDPGQMFKVGDVIPVKVIRIEKDDKRISLSRKARLAAPPEQGGGRFERRPQRDFGDRPPRPERPAGVESRGPAAPPRREGSDRPPRRDDAERRDRAPRPERTERSERPPRTDRAPAAPRSEPRRSVPDRTRERSTDRPERAAVASTGSFGNTSLADQLAALKEKFGGKS